MSDQGNHITSMRVSKPGITCAYLGYVEAKSTKACFFKSGKWTLSYNDTRGTSGGTTRTAWGAGSGIHGNTIMLVGYSPRTRVCRDMKVVCDAAPSAPTVEWKRNTQGPIFVSLFHASGGENPGERWTDWLCRLSSSRLLSRNEDSEISPEEIQELTCE